MKIKTATLKDYNTYGSNKVEIANDDFDNNFEEVEVKKIDDFTFDKKISFMKWGWIDLISSIPYIDFLRAGRVLRLIRLIRVFRAFKATKLIFEHINRNKKQSALTSVALISFLMVIFSSIAILQFEKDVNSNIKTAEDAIWWSYVTITTVGYGDKFPITTEGRIIGAVLMTMGVGIFGTFTALVSSWFIQNKD